MFREGAGDAHGDGVAQALEFRLGRGAATVQAWPFLFERVDAADEEHVQEDVEVQRRAESLDEGDGSGTRTGANHCARQAINSPASSARSMR